MTRNYPLTPGADRSLRRAAELAVQEGCPTVNAIHVLDALLDEEVVATRILEAFGVTHEVARQFRVSSLSAPELGQNDDYISELLDNAWSAFRQDGERSELESEHLLYGLIKARSTVAEMLSQMGLTIESGFEFLKSGNADVSPIEVDFSLSNTVEENVAEPGSASAADTPAAINTPQPEHNSDPGRVIDAVGNRLREGLRVVDDYVRFLLNDADLTAQVKRIRHKVAEEMKRIQLGQHLRSRDVAGDVGTQIHTDSELQRASLDDVVTANLKRIQESARSLEEFGKLIDSRFALAMKQVRYDSYTLESTLAGRKQTAPHPIMADATLTPRCSPNIADAGLYLLITESSCLATWQQTVESAVKAGVDVIQLREKSLTDRELIERALWVREATVDTNTLFLMNDRPDIAAMVDADGVHVGQDEASVAQARMIVGQNKLVGVSTHHPDQARQAVSDGADYIGVGPVFSSSTKSFDQLAGLELIRQVAAAELPIPFFAIGGINESNLGEVLQAGATRIAVTAAICRSDDVISTVAELKVRMTGKNSSDANAQT